MLDKLKLGEIVIGIDKEILWLAFTKHLDVVGISKAGQFGRKVCPRI